MRFNVGIQINYIGSRSAELHTDEKGKIYLGKLEGVQHVTARGLDQSITQKWDIERTGYD